MEQVNTTRKPEQELYELATCMDFLGEALDHMGGAGANGNMALSEAGALGLGKIMGVLSGSICSATSELAKQRDNLARAEA